VSQGVLNALQHSTAQQEGATTMHNIINSIRTARKDSKARKAQRNRQYIVQYIDTTDNSTYSEQMDSMALSNMVANSCGYIIVVSVEAL